MAHESTRIQRELQTTNDKTGEGMNDLHTSTDIYETVQREVVVQLIVTERRG